MRSAWRMVDSLWAITITSRLLAAARKEATSWFSVWGSRAAVGSSTKLAVGVLDYPFRHEHLDDYALLLVIATARAEASSEEVLAFCETARQSMSKRFPFVVPEGYTWMVTVTTREGDHFGGMMPEDPD